MLHVISFFKLASSAAGGAPSRAMAPKRAAARGGPVGRMQAGLAVAVSKTPD
jgi:hypothetical protein